MKRLSLGFIFFLIFTGCASFEMPPTLVESQYKPNRSGVIKMPTYQREDQTKAGKDQSTRIMKRFCAPMRPEIVSVKVNPPGSQWNETTEETLNQKYIEFKCVDPTLTPDKSN